MNVRSQLALGMFEGQEPVKFLQAEPVQNTWYTLFEESNCRMYYGIVNIEDANETVETEVTVDGQSWTDRANSLTHSTDYYMRQYPSAIARTNRMDLIANPSGIIKSFILEGHSVKIRLRKTTALGTGNLTGYIEWGKMKGVN